MKQLALYYRDEHVATFDVDEFSDAALLFHEISIECDEDPRLKWRRVTT